MSGQKPRADIRAMARQYLEGCVSNDLAAAEEDIAPEGALRIKASARLDEIADRQAEAYMVVCDARARTAEERRAKAAVFVCETLLNGDGCTELGLSIAEDILGISLEDLGDNEATAACEILRRGLI